MNNQQMIAPHTFTHTGNEVLILRRVPQNRVAYNGFVYPKGVGSVVEAPDFNTSTSCGGGLHGWAWSFGLGEGSDFDMIEDVWLILGAAPEDVVGELEGGMKCKCRKATIRYEGDFKGALDLLREGFAACIRQMSTVAAGDGSDNKKDFAKLAASGSYSKLAASGSYSKLAASGSYSKLAASGDESKLAASGRNSCAAISAGGGKVKMGERGAFALAYWTNEDGWDFVTGKVGRDGIKADTWYQVKGGKLVEC